MESIYVPQHYTMYFYVKMPLTIFLVLVSIYPDSVRTLSDTLLRDGKVRYADLLEYYSPRILWWTYSTDSFQEILQTTLSIVVYRFYSFSI